MGNVHIHKQCICSLNGITVISGLVRHYLLHLAPQIVAATSGESLAEL